MRLVNKTKWNSKQLKALITENIRKAGLDPVGYIVEVVTGRSGGEGYSGCARYSRQWFRMRVPALIITKDCFVGSDGKTTYNEVQTKQMQTIFDSVKFSQVCQHELAHNRGVRHGEMDAGIRYCEQDEDWAVYFEVKADGDGEDSGLY